MRSFGIKALQTNPALLTKTFESGEYSLITKHGVPIGLAVGFEDGVLEFGLKRYLALKAFQAGDMSLGELARSLGLDRSGAIEFLGRMKIPVADYGLDEERRALDSLGI